MKRLLQTVVLAFSLWMVGCQPHRYSAPLLVADSLSMAAPDSAVALLRALAPQMQKASKADRMYYELLRIKAADKAYQPHASDSTILQLVDYYEHGGDRAKLAEAYYYAGRISLDFHDAPQALDYYQRSYDVIEESDNKNQLKGALLSQLGYVFYYQSLDNEALEWHRLAYDEAKAQKDTIGLIFTLRDISDIYIRLKRYDQAEINAQEAMSYATVVKDSLMDEICRGQLAKIYLNKKEYQKAKDFLIPVLAKIHKMNQSGAYSTAANLYFATNNLDSSLFYSLWLLDNGTVYAKRGASKRLAEIYSLKNDFTKAMRYMRIYKVWADSVENIEVREAVAKAQTAYNYKKKEQENTNLRERNRAMKTLLLIVGLVIIINTLLILT